MAKSVSREKDRDKGKPTKSGAKPAASGKAPASAVKAAPVAKAAAVAVKPAAKPTAKAPAAKAPAPAAKAAVTKAPSPVVKNKEAPKAGKEREVAREPKEVIKYKCPIPSNELKQWREVLLSRRAEITDDIEGLVKDAMDAEDGHTTPNHIAERGSDADLQDMSLGVVGEEKEVVWQIDRALRKIDAAKPIPYGLCEFTKEPIPKTRLQLIPWTPLSIEGATHMEKNALTLEDLLADE